MRRTQRLVLFLFFLLASLPAYAQDDSARLKQVFETLINSQKTALQERQNIVLQRNGEITVEQDGDHFALTLPDISLIRPDAKIIHIGIISINAAKGENPGQWKISAALPTIISLKNALGQDILRLQIGSQKTAMIWDERFNNATKFDGDYKDISIQFTHHESLITLSELNARYDLDETGQALWSGPVFFKFTGAKWALPILQASGTLQGLQAVINLTDFNSSALFENTSPLRLLRYKAPEFLAHGKKIESQISLTALNHNKTSQNPGIYDSIKLGKASANVTLNNIADTTDSTVVMNAKIESLALPNIAESYAPLVPGDAQISFTSTGLPPTKWSECITTPGALLTLPQKIARAMPDRAVTLKLDNTLLSNSYYNAALNAKIETYNDTQTPTQAYANLKVKDLASLMNTLEQKSAVAPINGEGMLFRTVTALLARITSLGRIEYTEDGSEILSHNFNFEITPDNQVLLNKKTLNQLFIPTPSDKVPSDPTSDTE